MTVLRTHVIGNWLWEEGREDFTSEQPGAKHYVFKMSEKKRKSQLRQEPSDADVAAADSMAWPWLTISVLVWVDIRMNSLKNTRGEMMPTPGWFCVVEDLLEMLVSHPPSTYRGPSIPSCLLSTRHTCLLLQPAAWPLSCQLYKLFLFVMGKYHDTTNPASGRGWMASQTHFLIQRMAPAPYQQPCLHVCLPLVLSM